MWRLFQLWVLRGCASEDLEWELTTRRILEGLQSWNSPEALSEYEKKLEKTTGKQSKKSSKRSGSKGRKPRGARPTSYGLETLPSGEIVIPIREARGRLISYETPNGIGGLVECPTPLRPLESISPRSKGSGTRA